VRFHPSDRHTIIAWGSSTDEGQKKPENITQCPGWAVTPRPNTFYHAKLKAYIQEVV
jgi:hypothetical protein